MKREAPKNLRSQAPKWEKEAQELRDNPGEWFLLTEIPLGDDPDNMTQHARHIANGVTKGKYLVFRPAEAFRGSAEKRSELGVAKVFACYVGENGEYDS